MNPDLRRNACPTIAAPMETGDGLLARLPPLGDRDAAAFRAVADAASRFGNGVVEITARGSIQVRGLSPATTPGFAATLASAGIGDARPAVHVSPLVADPAVASLAAALRAAIEAAGLGPRLAPKTAVIVDGAGPLPLDGLDGDLRLVLGADEATLAIGGSATTARVMGRVPVDGALDAAVTVLTAMARLGPAARGRDLDAPAMAAAIGAAPAETAGARPPPEAIGVHEIDAGRVAIGVGLAFGHTDAATLGALIDAATDAGADRFEATVGRVLLAIGIRTDAAAAFQRRAAALGFLVEASDPRRAVVACTGAPGCASGRMAARGIADAATTAARAILDGGVTLHVSGCRKGCAAPRPATLVLAGTDDGLAVAVDGRALDAVPAGAAATDPAGAIARLAAAIVGERRPGETAAATIRRLGATRLAARLQPEPADA